MGLFTRAWVWATRRLLGGESIGMAGDYLVVDADTPDDELTDVLDLPAFRDPVDELRSLPDERGRIYLWECSDDAKATSLLRQFDEAGAGALDALHIVVADETELRELERQDLEPYIGGR